MARAAFLGLLVGLLGFCVILISVMESTGALPGVGMMAVIYVVTAALGLWWSEPVYAMLERRRQG